MEDMATLSNQEDANGQIIFVADDANRNSFLNIEVDFFGNRFK